MLRPALARFICQDAPHICSADLRLEKGMGKRKKERRSRENYLIESAIAEVIVARAGMGSVELAEAKLRAVLDLHPNSEERAEAHNLLAQLCAQTARHAEAMEHIAAAISAEPGMVAELTEALAEMLEKQDEWESAIHVYALGLAHTEHAILHDGLGYCLGKLGRLKEAEQHGRRATELEPDNATYVNDLGYTLVEQGRFQEAQVLFERALILDPSYDLARGNLRLCTEKTSQPAIGPRPKIIPQANKARRPRSGPKGRRPLSPPGPGQDEGTGIQLSQLE